MRLFISFAALFLSVTLLQLSSGAMGSLDAVSAGQLGFSNGQIGLLGSSHFIGFFIGCWWAPRLMGVVGHSRAFAAFAAFGAIGAMAHPMWQSPHVWPFLRMLTGLCVAGCYTVVEAWMQAKLTNSNRGKVMASYRTVDIVASSAAQFMIGALTPASYAAYNTLAILCCACLLPLMLTKSSEPVTPHAPRLRPIHTAMVSPLGAAGVIVAGTTTAAFRMVGPVYAQNIGLTTAQIGSFLATILIGGALALFPVGWLADRYDRRWVLIILSVLGIVVCSALVMTATQNHNRIFLLALLFGVTTYPIFSVSAAHANDFTSPDDTVEVNASLLFLYGIGAIASPLVTSLLMAWFGPSSLFAFISIAHVGLVVFGLWRMSIRPTVAEKTRYKYVPRTSFFIGRLMRRRKD